MTSEDMLVCAVCGSVWKSVRGHKTLEYLRAAEAVA